MSEFVFPKCDQLAFMTSSYGDIMQSFRVELDSPSDVLLVHSRVNVNSNCATTIINLSQSLPPSAA